MTEEAAPNVSEILRRLEERLLDPAVRSSGSDLGDLIADDFVEFGGSGRVYDKQQVVEAIRSEPPARRTIEDFAARSLAPGVVLVTYRARREDPGGQPAAASLRSSIWTWRDGRWQVVFHQGTPLSAPSPHG
jgi:hypothetical protein